MSLFILRFDDITPGMAWSKFKLVEQTLHDFHIKAIIGVVPDCKDPKLNVEPAHIAFWDKIRELHSKGWTIAQHGYRHEYVTENAGILNINKASEFAGLSFPEQYEKLRRGKEILQKEAVWQPTFMAPAHSYDETTIQALQTLNFKYITDGYALYPWEAMGMTFIPCLFSTPKHFGLGIYTICLHVNTLSLDKINALVRFINVNHHRIISFEQAILVSPPSNTLNKWFASLLGKSLQWMRNRKKNSKIKH